MTKAEIRRQIAARRPNLQCLEEMSTAVLKKLHTVGVFKQAKAIGAYMPLPHEINVAPLFEIPKKTWLVPAFDESIGSYRMAKYTPQLKNGKFGIPEPADPVWAGADELDLILVPGIAFDRTGNRLGRGGGFYDRLLPQYRATRVAVCFNFQLVDPIPAEPHDGRMDRLVTESEILEFTMNS